MRQNGGAVNPLRGAPRAQRLAAAASLPANQDQTALLKATLGGVPSRMASMLIGASPDPATVRAMALNWGVRALEVDTYHSTDELVWFAVERAVQEGLLVTGQTVLVLAGAPDRPSGASTDVLRIVRIS